MTNIGNLEERYCEWDACPNKQSHRSNNTARPRIARVGRGHVEKTGMFTEGVAGMPQTYRVIAQPWRKGWELHIGGVEVTQARSLKEAEEAVRDYLALLHSTDSKEPLEIEIIPHLNGVEEQAKQAREAVAEAARLQKVAAQKSRAAARSLRAAGLSVADTAAILGVSRGRVSQLTAT